jgi:cytochrome c oxidase subunit 1
MGKPLFLVSLSHKRVALSYFIFSFHRGLLGTSYSLLIRLELAKPGVIFGNPQLYNRIVTAHALVIIFFIVIPGLIGGYGNYLFPLLIKAMDLIFPRVNAFSFWVLPWSLWFLMMSLIMDSASGTGWTLYPPLRIEGHPTYATDVVLLRLHLSGISSISRSLNFIRTGFEIRGRVKLIASSLFI